MLDSITSTDHLHAIVGLTFQTQSARQTRQRWRMRRKTRQIGTRTQIGGRIRTLKKTIRGCETAFLGAMTPTYDKQERKDKIRILPGP